jgi:hypothetical protein
MLTIAELAATGGRELQPRRAAIASGQPVSVHRPRDADPMVESFAGALVFTMLIRNLPMRP